MKYNVRADVILVSKIELCDGSLCTEDKLLGRNESLNMRLYTLLVLLLHIQSTYSVAR